MKFKFNNVVCNKLNGCFISHYNGVLVGHSVAPSPTEDGIVCIDSIIIGDLINITNTEVSGDDINKNDGITLSDSVVIEIA
jgi:hypothetical protein